MHQREEILLPSYHVINRLFENGKRSPSLMVRFQAHGRPVLSLRSLGVGYRLTGLPWALHIFHRSGNRGEHAEDEFFIASSPGQCLTRKLAPICLKWMSLIQQTFEQKVSMIQSGPLEVWASLEIKVKSLQGFCELLHSFAIQQSVGQRCLLIAC